MHSSRLKTFRESLNLSQTALATRLGIPQRTYSGYETGRLPPSRVLNELARLGLNVHWLIIGEMQPQDGGRLAEPGNRYRIGNGMRQRVHQYEIKSGQLVQVGDLLDFDPSFVGNVPVSSLGGLILPAGWDEMLAYIVPGDRILLEIYDPPRSLRTAVLDSVFADGVYVFSLQGSLHIRRFQELPGLIVVVLSDNKAYRDMEVSVGTDEDLMLHARALGAEGAGAGK